MVWRLAVHDRFCPPGLVEDHPGHCGVAILPGEPHSVSQRGASRKRGSTSPASAFGQGQVGAGSIGSLEDRAVVVMLSQHKTDQKERAANQHDDEVDLEHLLGDPRGQEEFEEWLAIAESP